MTSAQVDAVHVEEFTKSSEETTIGSPTIEAPAKAPATQNIESPNDEDEDDDEEVTLPDELGKEDRLDDEVNQKALEPQIIDDDEDDEDENAEDDEEPASNSTGQSTDFSEEEGDEDEE